MHWGEMVKTLAFWIVFSFQLSAILASGHDDLHCNCEVEGFWSIERIMEFQKVSDFLIAVAYFSIPIELLCFLSSSNVPFKWVLLEFIAFIVLCGMTHFLTFWTYGPHSFRLVLALTIFKFLTAMVSIATAITLVTVIPLLLKVKVREFMLRRKTWDLDRRISIRKKEKEAALHVRMLTQEIRKSLDRHNILYTTLVELSKMLELKNCAVWMANPEKTEMCLTHELNRSNLSNFRTLTIPIDDPYVREIIEANDGAKILDPDSDLAIASNGIGEMGCVAAIRMPILRVSNFKGGTPEMVPAYYAVLVLVLPHGESRKWSNKELEILKSVADQVAVALSHASILEESQSMREKLVLQNQALQQAKKDALMANQARNGFQMVMSSGLRRPMHSILGLLSLLQDEKLSNEQQLVVDSMFKANHVLLALITDVMDSSEKDDGLSPLEIRPFKLHSTIKEVACISKCLSAYRGCDFKIEVDKSLEDNVIGDEKRMFQVILHMVSSLLNGSVRSGLLVLHVYPASTRSDGRNETKWNRWKSSPSDGFTFIQLDFSISYSSSQPEDASPVIPFIRQHCFTGVEERLSFNACKKLVQLMHGDMWVTSNAEGFDESMGLVVQLQLQPQPAIVSAIPESSDHIPSNSLLRGLRVLLADADDLNRAVTRKLLEKLGCDVTPVSTRNECMSKIGRAISSSYHIVLLDLQLPDLDGFEVAMRIRKFRSRSWPLIVALTASGDAEMRDKCSQMGINGVIQKPGTFQEFACELKRVLLLNNPLAS